jgi:hypothetical protein
VTLVAGLAPIPYRYKLLSARTAVLSSQTTLKTNKTIPRGGIKMTLLAAKEWNKVFYEGGQKYRIQVKAELEIIGGNKKPYFSIGGDIHRLAKNGRKVWECGGCIHEEIVKHFPQLQLLVDIHLADDEGVPMHAYANAAYFAGHGDRKSVV